MVFFINKVDVKELILNVFDTVTIEFRLILFIFKWIRLKWVTNEIIEPLAELNEDLLDYFLENKRIHNFG